MRRSILTAVAGLLSLPVVAWAANLPVTYTVNETVLRKQAPAGTLLTFELHADGACSSAIHSETVAVEDPALVIERVKVLRVRGGTRPVPPHYPIGL